MTSEGLVRSSKRSGEQVLSFMGALLFAVVSYPALAQSPPHLTAEQEAMVRRLEGMLIAPCCFANTVAEHRSPLSDQVREEVRALVAGGATETEILDTFVAKYGERILAAPKPQGFNLLAYVLPMVALAAGLVVIAFTLHRHRPRPVEPSAVPPETATDALRARMEAELTHFDD
jgi:cytochrome c-type biogenesis protein CcmH